MDWLTVMTGVVTPLLVCVIGGTMALQNDRRKKKDELARKLDIAMINVSMATARGLLVLLHQAHGDHLNGNVDEAIKNVTEAVDNMNDAVNTIAGGR